jgi:hypothetical protein
MTQEVTGADGVGGTGSPVVTDGFIPGTTFKTPEELAKGYVELKSLHDRQANELGTVRKEHEGLKSQTEILANVLKEKLTGGQSQMPDPKVVAKVDYTTELSTVEKQIQELDPLSPDYQRSLSSLVAKSNRLSAMDQHEKTLSAAGDMLKKELSERDIKSAHEVFRKANPTFDLPEMQARIRELISKDPTGMSDPLSAFREIQRDDISLEAQRLKDENAEYKRLIDLNKGKDEAGKVVVKTSTTAATPVKPTKLTGKDLDAGMMARLKSTEA